MKLMKEEWKFLLQNQRTLYQYFYSIAFLIAVYVYFIKRFVPGDLYVNFTLFSLLISSISFIWNLFLNKWSPDRKFAILAIAVFLALMPSSFYLLKFVPDFSLLSFFLLSVSVDPEQPNLIKILFYAKMILALGVLLFYISGKLPDITLFRPSKHLVRHSYGFMHPNSLNMFMVSIFYDFSLMRKKAVDLAELLWLVLLGLLVYAITDSRTGFLTFIILLVCALLKKPLMSVRVSGRLVFATIALIFLLGTGLSHLYDPESPTFRFLNSAFSGRLSNAHAYLKANGLSLLPRHISDLHYANGGRIFNENYYVDSLLRQGLVVYLLFPSLIAYQTLRKWFSLYHFIFILSVFLTAMMEDYGVSICICSILLFSYFALPQDEVTAKTS